MYVGVSEPATSLRTELVVAHSVSWELNQVLHKSRRLLV